METSNTENPFKLLDQVQKTGELCPRHNVPLIRLPGKAAFCPQCQKEKIAERERRVVVSAENFWQRRKTTDVLQQDSIFDDPDLKNASFQGFETTQKEAEKNWITARKIAYQYIGTLAYKKEQEAIRQKQKDNGEKVQPMDNSRTFNTLFTGLPGRGKSHLALSILKAVNESFNYPDSKYTEQNMVDLLGRVDLLVLDDLGSESSFKRDSREATEFVQNVLFGVLNRRNCTIVTTNLNSAEMSTVYNPKLLSRMYKGIKGHIITFTGATSDRRSVEF